MAKIKEKKYTRQPGIILPLVFLALSSILFYCSLILFQASMAYARALSYYHATEKYYR